MDVSNPDRIIAETDMPVGSQLIETVVSLTGLAEPTLEAVQAELGQVIHQSGHSSDALTLDQLREAMLAYLESFQAAFESGEQEELSQPTAPQAEKLKLVQD